MMKLKESPKTAARRRRTIPRPTRSTNAAALHFVCREPQVKRRLVTSESDEALSVALDRMIDDVLRRG